MCARNQVVAVFGSGLALPGSPDYEHARTLGQLAAKAGWAVCCGGYGGTMEAVARGAVEAGGHAIGVTCAALRRPEANAWIREEVATETLYERLRMLIERANAYIVLPGTTGTLLELALVWDLRHKRLMPLERLFVAVGKTWRPVVRSVAGDEETVGAPSGEASLASEGPTFVSDVAEAVALLIRSAGQPRPA